MAKMKDLLESLNLEIKGQRTEGFANTYRVGFNDGMEYAVAIMEKRTPEILGDGSGNDTGAVNYAVGAAKTVREDSGNWLSKALGGYLGK